MPSFIRAHQGGSVLVVRAKPRASRSEVLGVGSSAEGAFLECRLAALPVQGAANVALLGLLAEALHIPRRDVALLQGASGRMKRVHVADLSPDEVLARLGLPSADALS